jgi:hypothetical protein
MARISPRQWSSRAVEDFARQVEQTGSIPKYSPFFNRDTSMRAADLNYSYTEDEIMEQTKVRSNIFYFAETYAYVMTDDGLTKIKNVRIYQKKALAAFIKHLKNIWLASRQIGKSVTTALFIVWYILTNKDKNIVLCSQNQDKVIDLMEKIRVMIQNLPFHMKPGIVADNVMSMIFDNGITLKAQTTTENSAAGITGHLIYIDEFALINPNFLKQFFRTVFPSLSSSEIAKMIITSTPRGTNKFYELYKAALDGDNRFNPLRTDWYEVPLRVEKDGTITYRDENWKALQIADLGSEEDFNQEFGNQFLAGSKLLFGTTELKKLKALQTYFVEHEFDQLDDAEVHYRGGILKWHPGFNTEDLQFGKFVWSIDLAGGGGGDFSVINIFRVLPMSRKEMENVKVYSEEKDFFKLVQIGIWRSNLVEVPDVAKACYHMLTGLFNQENCKAVLERNYEGKLFLNTISEMYGDGNELDVDAVFVQFPIGPVSEKVRVGITIDEPKRDFSMKVIKDKIKNNQMIIVEYVSVDEAISFYKNKKGKFIGQGNDDIFMSCCNLTHVFDTEDYLEIIDDLMEEMPAKFLAILSEKLSRTIVTSQFKEDDDYADLLEDD